ncbi:hypothetical protein FDP41_010677 [Naegleria fowleri]|uniref:Uncharacterized protein n=1 Tax=Naegleria fowleri TaxID=5763 RepID=A0A6A5C9H3_NAEFO|nr:uncharacterized protein FDP41_010677 [Naegleria fowleri]KAF0983612.1 hypothetical protein FDP41_010677 [Naegleria fowleri]CAG4716300.1 unnamed protein product [Naegleria fowleri]
MRNTTKPKDRPLIEEIQEEDSEKDVAAIKKEMKKNGGSAEKKNHSPQQPKKSESAALDESVFDPDDTEEMKALKRDVLRKAFSAFKEQEEKKQEKKSSSFIFSMFQLVFIVSLLSFFIFRTLVLKSTHSNIVTPFETSELFTGNNSVKAFNLLLGMAYSPRLTLAYLAVMDRPLLKTVFEKSGETLGNGEGSIQDYALKVVGCIVAPRLFMVMQGVNILVDRHHDAVMDGSAWTLLSTYLTDFNKLYSTITESFWKNDKNFETVFLLFSIASQLLFILFDFASRISFLKRSVKFTIMLMLWVVMNTYFIPPMILGYMFKITYLIQPVLTLVLYFSETLEIRYEKQLLESQEKEQREAFIQSARDALKKAQESKKEK